MENVKPGYKTTEFIGVLVTAITSILTVLSALGVIGTDEANALKEPLASAVTAVGALIVNGVVLWKYIESRSIVKASALENG